MSNVHHLPEGRTLTPEEIERLASTSGGDGPTSGGMDIVDAKIAAAEARTDAKFAQVIGKLEQIQNETRGTKTTIILTAIAAIGVAGGIMAFGASQFGNGVMVTTAAVEDAQEAKRLGQENAAGIQQIKEEIGNLVQAIMSQRPEP